MTVLEELRDERWKEVIGQDLASLLARVAAATAKTYPPDYSPAGVWNDEAIEDVLQDWTEDRLLRRKDLSKLLAGARSEAALRAGLTTSIGQHLTNRRRRSAAANLYKRMQRMLRDDDAFKEALATGAAADRPWTVSAAQATVPSSLSEAEVLVRLAFELSDEGVEVVRYGPYSLKESPILRKPALRRFLIHMLSSAQGTLTPAVLIEIFKRRFNLVEPEEVNLDAAVGTEAPAIAPETGAVAASVIARMGRERCELVAAFARHGDAASAARGPASA